MPLPQLSTTHKPPHTIPPHMAPAPHLASLSRLLRLLAHRHRGSLCVCFSTAVSAWQAVAWQPAAACASDSLCTSCDTHTLQLLAMSHSGVLASSCSVCVCVPQLVHTLSITTKPHTLQSLFGCEALANLAAAMRHMSAKQAAAELPRSAAAEMLAMLATSCRQRHARSPRSAAAPASKASSCGGACQWRQRRAALALNEASKLALVLLRRAAATSFAHTCIDGSGLEARGGDAAAALVCRQHMPSFVS
jgi:hypothetical protein